MFSNSIIRHINLYYLLIDKLNILNSFIVHFIAYPTCFQWKNSLSNAYYLPRPSNGEDED